MRDKRRHARPSDARVRKAIAKAERLIRLEPDDVSTGYRRGFSDALRWVLGENYFFDRKFRTRERKTS